MSEPQSQNPLERQFFATGQPKTSSRLRIDEPARTYPVGSSEWWIIRLLRRMNARNARLQMLRDYYRGENSTWSLADRAHRDTFGARFKDLRANLAQPVVEVPEQRMTVIGMTLWDDDAGSDLAWDIWQQNALDARSAEAHLELLSTGICPVAVDPWRFVAPGIPLITVEDPLGVIVEHDPADSHTRYAALKRWTEHDGRRTVILYLPDRIEWWRTERKVEDDGKQPVWQRLEGAGGQNRLGVVPIVELRNAPRARAEHEGIIDQLRLYAMTLYQMTTAAHYTAYRHRWATGVDQDELDAELGADGQPLTSPPASAEAGADTVTTAADPSSRFGTFEQSDMVPFIRQLEALRTDIATISHTPHRLLLPPPTSVPPSGESTRLADFPLTAKVRRKHTTVGNGWETVLRLAFLARGDLLRSRRMDLETVWADPELHTEAQHVDALVKMQAMGVPQEELWRRLGATPQQIRRWLRQSRPEPMPPQP